METFSTATRSVLLAAGSTMRCIRSSDDGARRRSHAGLTSRVARAVVLPLILCAAARPVGRPRPAITFRNSLQGAGTDLPPEEGSKKRADHHHPAKLAGSFSPTSPACSSLLGLRAKLCSALCPDATTPRAACIPLILRDATAAPGAALRHGEVAWRNWLGGSLGWTEGWAGRSNGELGAEGGRRAGRRCSDGCRMAGECASHALVPGVIGNRCTLLHIRETSTIKTIHGVGTDTSACGNNRSD